MSIPARVQSCWALLTSATYERIGTGLINDTWRANTAHGGPYVLPLG